MQTDMVDLIDVKTPDADELRKRVFCDALAWTEEEGGSLIVGGKDNRVVCPSLPSCLSPSWLTSTPTQQINVKS